MEFKEYWLKDLGEIVTGKTPSKSKPEYYNSKDIMFIKPDDLDINKIISLNNSKAYISKVGAEKVRTLPRNSIVVTCIGIIGKVGIVNNDTVAFNQQINAIIPNEEIIIPKYLAYRIWYDRNILKDIANAPVVPIINKSQFSNIKITVPSLEYQKRVIEFLEYAEGLINKRKSQIEALDQLTHSVFLEMFGDPVKNHLNWEQVDLERITTKITDGEHNNPQFIQEGLPMVMAKNVLNNSVDLTDVSLISWEDLQKFRKKCNPEKDDVLLVGRGATIGRTCVIDTDREFALMGSVILIKPNKDLLNSYFLKNLLNHPYYKNKLLSTSGSSAQQAIYLKDLKKMELILPNIDLQNSFAGKIKQIEQKKSLLNQSLIYFDNIYNALMQRAFKGELFTQDKISNA